MNPLKTLRDRLYDGSTGVMNHTENLFVYWLVFVVCWLSKPATAEILPENYWLIFPDEHNQGEEA